MNGKPDLTHWLEYYVEGMLIEAERAQWAPGSRIDEMQAQQAQNGQSLPLSSLQIQLLRFTQEQGQAKTADFVKISSLSRKGTYNALQKLVEWELLRRIGTQKASHYVITEKGLNLL